MSVGEDATSWECNVNEAPGGASVMMNLVP